MNEETKKCPRCDRELVWHEGAFSGWVHSNNFAENTELVAACKEQQA